MAQFSADSAAAAAAAAADAGGSAEGEEAGAAAEAAAAVLHVPMPDVRAVRERLRGMADGTAVLRSWDDVCLDRPPLRPEGVGETSETAALFEAMFSGAQGGGEDGTEDVLREFLTELAPFAARCALEMEDLFQLTETEDTETETETVAAAGRAGKVRLQYLLPGVPGIVVLSQRHVLCLMCHALFGTMPRGIADLDLGGWFGLASWVEAEQREKLLCFFAYLRTCCARLRRDPDWQGHNVIVARRALRDLPTKHDWIACTELLAPFRVHQAGTIEDDARGALQADFANEYIGGGVLHTGCVQEEIRFVINPECLVSMLLCPRMQDDESILIAGTERFSNYSGYAWRFAYAGMHDDPTPAAPADQQDYIDTRIVALDAVPYAYVGTHAQYRDRGMVRDMNKCLAALHPWLHEAAAAATAEGAGGSNDNSNNNSNNTLSTFATGNWGCGAFGGDPQLKALQQWVVASRVGRSIDYFTFKDKRIHKHLPLVIERIEQARLTVGELSLLLFAYCEEKEERESVFEYILRRLTTHHTY